MKWLVATIFFAAIAGGIVYYLMMLKQHDGMQMPTAGGKSSSDFVPEKMSENGIYRLRFEPANGEPEMGPITVWHITVTTPEGDPVENAEIEIDGSMPDHGHGLPTAPAVTGTVSAGVYTIDGVRLSMAGWWEFVLTVDAMPGEDTASFNVMLSP
jgi:hypothetical protein